MKKQMTLIFTEFFFENVNFRSSWLSTSWKRVAVVPHHAQHSSLLWFLVRALLLKFPSPSYACAHIDFPLPQFFPMLSFLKSVPFLFASIFSYETKKDFCLQWGEC